MTEQPKTYDPYALRRRTDENFIEASTDPNTLMTTDEAAELLAVSRVTVAGWRARKIGPPWIKLGHGTGSLIRYRYGDLVSFIWHMRQLARKHPPIEHPEDAVAWGGRRTNPIGKPINRTLRTEQQEKRFRALRDARLARMEAHKRAVAERANALEPDRPLRYQRKPKGDGVTAQREPSNSTHPPA